MPPKMTPPNGLATDTDTDTAPPELVPNPDTLITDDSASDDTFAGLPIIAAKKQTRDAFNVLFYAYPGVGKTTIAGMFAGYPPACDVLVIDAEGGASVLAHLDNVYVMRVKTWDEVLKVLIQLERAPLDSLRYRTIVFDNLTELHAMLITKICGTRAPEIQEHGIITAALMNFTRRVRDLSRFRGIHTALIAWQDTREDKSRGITRQTVALTDKLSTRIPGIPNNVGHMTVLSDGMGTRHLSFAVTPLNDAKLRRAPGDGAAQIPLDIFYGLDQNPIADMLATIYDGVPFPATRYARPKRTRAGATSNDTQSDASGNA